MIADTIAVDPSTTSDELTYHSIINSANEILVGFFERIPHFVASVIVVLIFWFLSIIFKKIVHKLLGSRSRHQNLVKVFQRVGGALIIFIGFMIAMVIAVPGFTPAKLIGAVLLPFTGWNRLQGEHFTPRKSSHGYLVRERMALQLLQRIFITLFMRTSPARAAYIDSYKISHRKTSRRKYAGLLL